MARQPQPAGLGEACEAPSQPVWGKAKVPLPQGDDKIDIVCARELLQHEGLGREKEEEAAGEAEAEQHRPNLGFDQRRWGVHPRQVEGVQVRLKHHERVNERAPRVARRDVLCRGILAEVEEQDLCTDISYRNRVLQGLLEPQERVRAALCAHRVQDVRREVQLLQQVEGGRMGSGLRS